MRRIAIATTASNDDVDLDPDAERLLAALSAVELEGALCVWDDPTVAWSDYSMVVVRSTWDYTRNREGFLAWARARDHLFNPYPVIEYSTDKHYLRDLERRGHRIVATTFCDVGEEPLFPDSAFVVKPTVGAGSMDADKYGRDEQTRARAHVGRLHESGRDAMIQPYVESIDADGERAMVFIDGAFSHAMTKGAMLNVAEGDRDALFRREQMSVATPEPDALAFAEATLSESLFHDLLYARVDLVRVEGGWAVMELELVEPSLFLTYDEHAAGKLAEAIRARLD